MQNPVLKLNPVLSSQDAPWSVDAAQLSTSATASRVNLNPKLVSQNAPCTAWTPAVEHQPHAMQNQPYVEPKT